MASKFLPSASIGLRDCSRYSNDALWNGAEYKECSTAWTDGPCCDNCEATGAHCGLPGAGGLGETGGLDGVVFCRAPLCQGAPEGCSRPSSELCSQPSRRSAYSVSTVWTARAAAHLGQRVSVVRKSVFDIERSKNIVSGNEHFNFVGFTIPAFTVNRGTGLQ